VKPFALDYTNPNVRKHISLIATGLLFGLAIYIYISTSQANGPSVRSAFESILAAVSGIGIMYLLYTVTRKLDSMFPWKQNTGLRLLLGLLVNSILAFGAAILLAFFYNILVKGNSGLLNDSGITIKLAILVFIAVFLYSIIYFGLHSYHIFTKGQIDTVQQERKQIDLQLRTLKAKLSPHFLFNSLNTVSSLLYSNTQKAENFVRDLAKSYQYTLATYDQKWVTVAEELNFVRSYHQLLKTRFADQILLEVDVPSKLMATKIPPLTLQMLVENAAKHNTMRPDKPLRIEIDGDEDWLWVLNTKSEAPKKVTSTEVGLKTIRERYQILSGKDIVIEDGTYFNVKLPVVL